MGNQTRLGYLRGEHDVGPDASEARSSGQAVGIDLWIKARRIHVASKVGTGEAAVATLHVLAQTGRLCLRGVSREHSEPLEG